MLALRPTGDVRYGVWRSSHMWAPSMRQTQNKGTRRRSMATAEFDPQVEAEEGRPEDLSDLTQRGTPAPGVGLCLSGGGYRAMLFHVGALWRLYDTGVLKGASRVSSVSGGSITSGLLALKWSRLGFDPAAGAAEFVREVALPQPLQGRLSGRNGRASDGRHRHSGRGVVGVPAGAVADDPRPRARCVQAQQRP